MTQPRELSKKYLDEFDHLIREGDSLTADYEDYREENPSKWDEDFQRATRWMSGCSILIHAVVPSGSPQRADADELRNTRIDKLRLIQSLGKVKAIRDGLEKNLFTDIGGQIEAEVNSDFMAQAETLLKGDNSPGEHYYVAAAVLAGAVLERSLRFLCEKQEPPLPTVNEKGKPFRLDRLISDLRKADVFNAAMVHELRAWAAIRNHAAHGEIDEIDVGRVSRMIESIREFLAKNL